MIFQRRTVAILLTVIAASLVGLALTGVLRPLPVPTAGSTPQTPAPTGADVVKSPEPSAAAECLGHFTTLDRVPPTFDTMLSVAKAALVGTVESVSDARWNTKDGTRPAFESAASVYRTVVLKVETVVKGELRAGTVSVRLPGGTIGCDVYIREDLPDPRVGDRFLVFLAELPYLTGEPATDLTVDQAWLVSDEGTVLTPEDGPTDLTELLAEQR